MVSLTQERDEGEGRLVAHAGKEGASFIGFEEPLMIRRS